MVLTKAENGIHDDLHREKATNEELRSSLMTAKSEVIEMDEELYRLTERVLAYSRDVKAKEHLIERLAQQLEQSNNRIQLMEKDLGMKRTHKNGGSNTSINSSGVSSMCSSSEDENTFSGYEEDFWPRVVLFHDSICDDINESIMIREKVTTKKIAALNLRETKEKLENVGQTDVIVLQALTKSMLEEGSEGLYKLINETTCLALSKANKVVISTIIVRDDDDVAKGKSELVNAMLQYFYVNEPRVVICTNENLHEAKFHRKGELRLTPHGTSLLAINLKHKIADALDIQVVKKPSRSYRQRKPSK